jgi:hypothetical protein
MPPFSPIDVLRNARTRMQGGARFDPAGEGEAWGRYASHEAGDFSDYNNPYHRAKLAEDLAFQQLKGQADYATQRARLADPGYVRQQEALDTDLGEADLAYRGLARQQTRGPIAEEAARQQARVGGIGAQQEIQNFLSPGARVRRGLEADEALDVSRRKSEQDVQLGGRPEYRDLQRFLSGLRSAEAAAGSFGYFGGADPSAGDVGGGTPDRAALEAEYDRLEAEYLATRSPELYRQLQQLQIRLEE